MVKCFWMCISSSVGLRMSKESESMLRMIIHRNWIKNKRTIEEMGCHIFHLRIFTVLQLTMNTLEDGLSTERRRLEESANNPSNHPTNKWVQWAHPHSLWKGNLSKDWTILSSETQWLLWPHFTREDELIVYCHETLISRYQANEINITRETFFNAGPNPRCERAQLPCHYNMTRCEGNWVFALFMKQC